MDQGQEKNKAIKKTGNTVINTVLGSGRPFYHHWQGQKGGKHLYNLVLKIGLGSANGIFLIFLTFLAPPQKLLQR